MLQSTAISMFGLLSFHAEQLANVWLDVAAMKAIAGATIEELGGDIVNQTTTSINALLVSLHSDKIPTLAAHAQSTVHKQIQKPKLQHLTLNLLIDELRQDCDHPSISNVLVTFLLRVYVSDLWVVPQLSDSPGSECCETGGGSHPTVTIEG